MKFKIIFKTPDAADFVFNHTYMTDDEKKAASKLIQQFAEYGEGITIDFDTDQQTATVRKL